MAANNQIVRSQEPLPSGFMRNGNFAWPMRRYVCKGCGVEFLSQNGNVHRCQECRPKHDKYLQQRWREANGNKNKVA